MAVVNWAALLVLTFKEEQLDLKKKKVDGDAADHDGDNDNSHLMSEVVNLGDQPRPALNLPGG